MTLVEALLLGVPLGFILAVFVFRVNPWLLTKLIGYANIASAAAKKV